MKAKAVNDSTSQSARFREAAKEVGADDPAVFERAFKKVVGKRVAPKAKRAKS